MKTLLIITGPQGSGNHLFSKILAQHPDVFGWDSLTKQYWVAHDQEPFAEAWHNPALLKDVKFNQNYAVTSISCPYAYKGVTTVPDYDSFIMEALDLGYRVKVAIIGRDKNVLQHQQERVRGTFSLPKFHAAIEYITGFNPVFLSTELLYLYKENYVRSLSSLLGIPVATDTNIINKILEQDPNSKYFVPAPAQELDKTVRKVSGLI